MSKKYFIDCGGHNGISVKFFRGLHDPNCEYYIHTFEPLLVFQDKYHTIKNHTLHKKAAWIHDGFTEFYEGDGYCGGSSLIKVKKGVNREEPIRVETIDFSKWIKDTFNKDDYIILKMNIEGAEYAIFDKMIEDGTIDYIDKIVVEWHWKKVRMRKDAHTELVNRIKVPIEEIGNWRLKKI